MTTNGTNYIMDTFVVKLTYTCVLRTEVRKISVSCCSLIRSAFSFIPNMLGRAIEGSS